MKDVSLKKTRTLPANFISSLLSAFYFLPAPCSLPFISPLLPAFYFPCPLLSRSFFRIIRSIIYGLEDLILQIIDHGDTIVNFFAQCFHQPVAFFIDDPPCLASFVRSKQNSKKRTNSQAGN